MVRSETDLGRKFEGWKEIHGYLGVALATAYRWFRLKDAPLPVHKMELVSGGRVYAFKRELDDWRLRRTKRAKKIVVTPARSIVRRRPRINLAGKWEYLFLVAGRTTVWGGVVEIDQAETEYGVQLILTGRRQWEKNPRKKKLANPIYWHSDWGMICHDRKIRFSYRIKYPAGSVDGFVVGGIGESPSQRTPDTITGQFYQLPPHSDATHGIIEFRRVAQ